MCFERTVHIYPNLPSMKSPKLCPARCAANLRARGSTHRSLGRPLGDDSLPACRIGNQMVARCCLLIMLAASRGIWWVLEQPRGSLLQYHPAFEMVSKLPKIYRKHIRMGDFGSATEKGTWLYSSLRLSQSKRVCYANVCFLSHLGLQAR